MTKFAVGIGIAVIAALIGAPTFAQLPSPTAVQPASIWSGWYAGVNGGWGWNANVQNQTIVTTSSPGLGGYPNATSGIMNPNGVFGGVTLGYNWQLANIVFGAEGDFDVASIVNHLPSRTIDVFNDQLTAEQDLNWFSTIRGRLGYAFGNLLVYGTGGWAYGRVNNYLSLTLGAAPFGIATWQDNGEKSGYTVGGGFEYMFLPRLSFKAEYQYIDLGSFTAGSAPLVGGWRPSSSASAAITRSITNSIQFAQDWTSTCSAAFVPLPLLMTHNNHKDRLRHFRLTTLPLRV